MKYKVITFILLALLLQGCSKLTYVEPTSDQRSKVRFATTNGIGILRQYESESCENETEWVRLRKGSLLGSSEKKLGIPLWNYHKNAAKEVYVESNKDFYFMFFGETRIGSTTYTCAVPVWANFQTKKSYEIVIHPMPSSCTVDFTEIVKNDTGGYVKVIKQQFTNKISSRNFDCKSSFEKARFY
jgi:hypothetical protein